ncbi:class I SAM-dependent DNA methyltransferase [Virgibacillus byunsanensis]|uniref:Uncharacterized methyltransferase ACFQ3N_04170 n=1 Tax=Virgibacillus byunsanensis TaxID=570945 RepID=A0ABW3LGW7_9BACI
MGREFLDLFDNWATTYDDSVAGQDPQYQAVFANYEVILNKVTENSYGNILEFGVGTGNLTEKLINAGHQVFGIEPSQAMRKIAAEKLPNLHLMEGDFISFPKPTLPIDTIVSTYAFHHLTDEEKEVAIKQYADMLPQAGKIVFADTMFEDEDVKEKIIEEANKHQFYNLSEDLKREYYPTKEVLQNIFLDHNFGVSFKQMNDFVWLIIANKKE